MYCFEKEFHLTIARHGQTEANLLKNIQGHSNTPLTQLGLEQARALASYFERQHLLFDRLYSSDLNRAYETCRIIAASCKRTESEIVKDVRLRERAYGPQYEGKPIARLQEDAYQVGFDASSFTQFTPDGVESMEEVRRRVGAFCAQTLWQESQPGEEVLIVSHWATIKEFFKLFQPLANGAITKEDLLETPNAAFNRFRIQCKQVACGEKTHKLELNNVEVISLHQIPHLSRAQSSVNLRQPLA